MDLLRYILYPQVIDVRKPKYINLLYLILLYFLFVILSVPLISYSISLFGVKHITPNHLDKIYIFIGVFFTPVYEEILCRLSLVFNEKNFYVTLICAFIFATIEFFREKYLLSIVFFVLFLGLISVKSIDRIKLKQLYSTYFKYLFWFSALFFGLLHITNFQGNLFVIFMLSPLLCLPQIVMGLILGSIRMNNGFIYSVFIHFVINSNLLLNLLHK